MSDQNKFSSMKKGIGSGRDKRCALLASPPANAALRSARTGAQRWLFICALAILPMSPRRRQGASARKDARSKLMLQKRQCPAGGAAPGAAVEVTPEQLAACIGVLATNAEALGQLRLLLCTAEPPVSAALELGVMEQLCTLLQPGADATLALEAAWCVTNIASSGLTDAEAQHVLGAAPLLIGHLGAVGTTPEMQTQAAWSIGNLAADSDVCRATLRSGGAVPPLIAALGSAQPLVVHTAAWALSNLARGVTPRRNSHHSVTPTSSQGYL